MRLLAGAASSETAAASSPLTEFSLPLLGSRDELPLSVGGPAEEEVDLVITQDNALVSTRNPLGTIPRLTQDQILIYTVETGDTPGAIAEEFGISLNTLLWANNIRSAKTIKAGDELIILPVTGVQYEVRRGDTVEGIAKKFRGDPAEILSFNGLGIGEPLEVGTIIIIPDGELAPVSPPAVKPSVRFSRLPEHRGYYLRPILGGRRSRGIHGFNGVDLADSCGQPILASAEGTVIVARFSGWNGGYGKYVVVTHRNGTQTLYAHLSSVLASVGQAVSQGARIAAIGSTGNSTGCHIHFEIRGAKNPF